MSELLMRYWSRATETEQRYKDDPLFATLVDTLLSMLEMANNAYTPTELREAVMLAATIYETTHIRPLVIHSQNSGLK